MDRTTTPPELPTHESQAATVQPNIANNAEEVSRGVTSTAKSAQNDHTLVRRGVTKSYLNLAAYRPQRESKQQSRSRATEAGKPASAKAAISGVVSRGVTTRHLTAIATEAHHASSPAVRQQRMGAPKQALSDSTPRCGISRSGKKATRPQQRWGQSANSRAHEHSACNGPGAGHHQARSARICVGTKLGDWRGEQPNRPQRHRCKQSRGGQPKAKDGRQSLPPAGRTRS